MWFIWFPRETVKGPIIDWLGPMSLSGRRRENPGLQAGDEAPGAAS